MKTGLERSANKKIQCRSLPWWMKLRWSRHGFARYRSPIENTTGEIIGAYGDASPFVLSDRVLNKEECVQQDYYCPRRVTATSSNSWTPRLPASELSSGVLPTLGIVYGTYGEADC